MFKIKNLSKWGRINYKALENDGNYWKWLVWNMRQDDQYPLQSELKFDWIYEPVYSTEGEVTWLFFYFLFTDLTA
jgi:hypothetical protein